MNGKKYWVWLSAALGAAARVDEILSAFPDPKELYEATKSERMLAGVFTWRQIERMDEVPLSEAERRIEICEKNGWNIVVPSDKIYPAGLRKIPDRPLVLYVDGDISCLRGSVMVGIVGTREPCNESVAITRKISGDIASAGGVVVSGGALGIDSAAHEGALEKNGKTVCVLGCGLGTDYLKTNEAMRRAVAKSGAVITEYPPFARASRTTFPERNRIISGMSHGVLVIEAGPKSGSLITARCAAEQGRDVFAIPGSVLVSAYTGVNSLIKDGAKAVTGAKDVLEAYAVMYPDRLDLSVLDDTPLEKAVKTKTGTSSPKPRQKLVSGFGADADTVYNLFGDEPIHPDDICAESGLPMSKVIAALIQLEIGDLIRQIGGKLYILKD